MLILDTQISYFWGNLFEHVNSIFCVFLPSDFLEVPFSLCPPRPRGRRWARRQPGFVC